MALAPARPRTLLAEAMFLLIVFWVASSFPTRWDSESLAVNTSPVYYATQAAIEYFLIPVCVFLCLQKFRTVFPRLLVGGAWIALCGWAVLSALWSVEPRASLFAAASISTLVLMMAYIASQLDDALVSRLIARYMIALGGISMAIAIAAPQYGLMNTPKFAGLLRGVYSHKNLLGDVVSLMLLWTLCAVFARRLTGLLAIVACGVGAVALLWTWSVTSILMILICLGLLFALRAALALRLSTAAMMTGIVVFALLAMLVIPMMSDTVLGYFGKDMSFSGRDAIWKAYLDMANQRPFYGYGFRAIANSASYGIHIVFANGLRPSPHNSFIQLYLDLGLPAVIVYAAANLIVIWAGVRRIGAGDPFGLFNTVVPVGYALNSLMEGVGCLFNSIGLVLLLYVTMRPVFAQARRRVGSRSILGSARPELAGAASS